MDIGSSFCDHRNFVRINKNFINCKNCGRSFVSQIDEIGNKTSKDFVRENREFDKKFDRNFTNLVDDTVRHEMSQSYVYADENNNVIKIYSTGDKEYRVCANNNTYFLTKDRVRKLLLKCNARRIL
jgi:hypothetical protein